MAPSEPHVPLAARLRQALADAGVSQRELARRVVARTDGPNANGRRVENERRQIGRYLEGKHSPEPDRARLYADLLEKPADYFIDEQPSRAVDLLVELRGMVAVVTEMIEAAELLARLEALEAKVAVLPTAADLQGAVKTLQAAIDRLATGGIPAAGQGRTTRRTKP